MAEALRWVSRLTTVSLEMVLPGLIGLWLDRQCGTVILFTLLGFGLGLTVGIWHLIRMTSAEPHGDPPRERGGERSESQAEPPDRGSAAVSNGHDRGDR